MVVFFMSGKLTYHERAMRAARGRWGEPRIARLDGLDPNVRAAIVALIEADKAAKQKAAAEGQDPATAETEVRGGSLDSAA